MKNRLSKSIDRLKKENKISKADSIGNKKLSAYNVKVFRSLTEKYDLSLTINEKTVMDKNDQENLSLGAQITLERLNKGENFSP